MWRCLTGNAEHSLVVSMTKWRRKTEQVDDAPAVTLITHGLGNYSIISGSSAHTYIIMM